MPVCKGNEKRRQKPIGFARPVQPAQPAKPARGGILRPAKPGNVVNRPPKPAVSQEVKRQQIKVQTTPSPIHERPPYPQQPYAPYLTPGGHALAQQFPFQPAPELPVWIQRTDQTSVNEGTNIVSTKLDDILTAIDQGCFSGRTKDLTVDLSCLKSVLEPRSRSFQAAGSKLVSLKTLPKGKALNPFAKVDLYANSRLPENLSPTKLYLPAWPLICLAAQYSEQAYDKPKGAEKHLHVQPDRKGDGKAMVIKSVPVDHMDVIVFAIRGTQSFRDWATNFNSNATSTIGFLDDPGNFCHAGFLEVAKKMIVPVATRLRKLLEENPRRSLCSLVITGHSAGGAVASLLFCHMLSSSATSELTALARSFKRIHCITFGAPPVSGLPLLKPQGWQHRRSLFLSFINEGDPVSRADPAYVRSLLDLYLAPAPSVPGKVPTMAQITGPWSQFKLALSQKPIQPTAASSHSGPIWPVPPCSLSNAGRIIVLRKGSGKNNEQLYAITTTDQGLRGAIFGDPLMHMMKIYRERVEGLASRAITGGAWS